MMRLAVFTNVFLPYENILHAHSHIAFQGWLYLALFLFITKSYLNPDQFNKERYRWQLYTTIVILFGVLVSFLVQGYGLFSIIFSSLFQVMNYIFCFTFLVDTSKLPKVSKAKMSLKFIRVAVVLLSISTLGPWGVAIFSANGLADTEYFDTALYFFFHFQYNGWFTFAILGAIIYLAEQNHIQYNSKWLFRSYQLLLWSVVPAFSLSLLDMSYANLLEILAVLAGIIQFMGIIFFVLSWNTPSISFIMRGNYLLSIGILCLTLKYLLQLASSVPYFKELAFLNKPIIIGYIHLTMIGFLTFVLLGVLTELKWLTRSKIGWMTFLLGFLSSEIVLLLIGFQPQLFHYKMIVLSSVLMAIGVILIFIRQLFNVSV
ncbi:MAG: hypothetical protein H6582_03095 [Crocinitomicaceae bacterium]|nr:hypothetical protein [Crocinitomicaceae bacterium]